jgi:hypothetical protein
MEQMLSCKENQGVRVLEIQIHKLRTHHPCQVCNNRRFAINRFTVPTPQTDDWNSSPDLGGGYLPKKMPPPEW